MIVAIARLLYRAPPSRQRATVKALSLLPIVTIAASAALPASAAAPVSPTDVADLFLKVAIHNDLDSAGALNDYIRPVSEGQATFNLDAIRKRHDTTVEATAELFTATFGKETAQQVAHAMVDTIEKSQCRAITSTTTPSATSAIATVQYHCLVADIAGLKRHVAEVVAAEKDQTKAIAVLASAMLDSLRTVKIDRPVDGKLELVGRNAPRTGEMIWSGDASLPDTILNTLETEASGN
jgi:hypothetical protein